MDKPKFWQLWRRPDESWAANDLPFGGVDDAGYPVVEFTPSVVDLIRVGTSAQSLGNLYRTQWAVRTCVNFLALNVAHLNLKTYRRTPAGPLYVPEHPLAQLLQRPNDQTTRFDMVRDTVSDLAIYANAYWLKRTLGQQRSLFRIPPIWVQPRGGSVIQRPSTYLVDTGGAGRPLEFPADQIVHFRSYNPTDPRIGSPILEAVKAVLNEEIEASRHRERFWKRGARIDGVIERPKDAPKWDKGGRERFREGWRRFMRGGDRESETAVLEDGMTYKGASFSPRDAEFIAGREWALETVATAYQIPLALLSRKGTATFASMKEFHKVLYSDVLGPWNALIEGTLGLQLVPDFDDPDLYVEFNIDEKLQGDFEQQAAAARQSVQVPWQSVDDMRKLRGLPPLGGEFAKPAKPRNYEYVGDIEDTDEGGLTLAANGHQEIEALEPLEVP